MVTDTDGHNPQPLTQEERGWNAELRAERIELLQPSKELLQPRRKCCWSPRCTCAGLGFNIAPTCVEQEPTSRQRGCAARSLQIQVDMLRYVGNSLEGPWEPFDLLAMLEVAGRPLQVYVFPHPGDCVLPQELSTGVFATICKKRKGSSTRRTGILPGRHSKLPMRMQR